VYAGSNFNSNCGIVVTQEGDTGKYYVLLVERVGKMAAEGKSLDEIKKELKMPEYDHWATKERFPSNVEAAYKVVKGS
jgi:hypothetical protein